MRPFLFITSLVHSLGPPISPKRSKYDISFSYLHSLALVTQGYTKFFIEFGLGFSCTPAVWRELMTCWGTLQIRIWFVLLPLKQTNKQSGQRSSLLCIMWFWNYPKIKKVIESYCLSTSVTSQTIRGASNNRTINFFKLRSSVTKSNDFSWTNKGKVLRIKD